MRHKNSYYIKQINSRSDYYHVCCHSNDLPVFDGSLNGDDKPLVFKDEDTAIEYRDKLNQNLDSCD